MKVLRQLAHGWNLTLVPNATLKKDKFEPQCIEDILSSPYETVPATVPGNFELDLLRAGKIEDPFFSTNILKLQKYENRHLFYTLKFDAPSICTVSQEKPTFLHRITATDSNYPILRFEGIDTVAYITLNGIHIGYSENMFLPYEAICPNLREKDNELIVHILPSAIHARGNNITPANFAQYYNYATLSLRKAAYMFGWDIMPRAVSGGIWKSVALIEKQSERIEHTYLYVNSLKQNNTIANLNLFYQIKTEEDDIRPFKITVDGICGESQFHASQGLWHTGGNLRFQVKDPLLWYPKNAGEPHLYQVQVKLWHGEKLVDKQEFDFGIRTVELIRTSTIDNEGNGDFHFRVNGKRVFILGTNWVPLDVYPSQNPQRLPRALSLLDDIGVNMVRLWGGNVYEDDAFFDFCDHHGILVWHDFAMGCAVYPQDEVFLLKMQEEVTAVVRRTRQHACLALWAGDNECDLAYSWNGLRRDPNVNLITRRLIPQIIQQEDPVRPYLPSSPYLDEHAYASCESLSEDHLWGPRDYFKGAYYKNAKCAFASETGYHGCPAPRTLEKFIRSDQLYPITDENGKIQDDWLVKSSAMELRQGAPYTYRIPLMTSQLVNMFGQLPDSLEMYAKLSQISQAEAFKYFIERFRIGKWKRSGIIWWNLLDGCPQISDAIVDYYFVKKLAYSYIKRVQTPVCMMMDEAKEDTRDLVVVNDTPQDMELHYTVREMYDGVFICQGTVTAKADSTLVVTSLPAYKDEDRFYLIEWTYPDACFNTNHYMTRTTNLDAQKVLNALTACHYDCFEGFE